MTRTRNQNPEEEKEIEATEEKIEETKIDPEEVSKDSQSKEDYKKLIEVYKNQNPVKYEQKKGEIEAKLKSL